MGLHRPLLRTGGSAGCRIEWTVGYRNGSFSSFVLPSRVEGWRGYP